LISLFDPAVTTRPGNLKPPPLPIHGKQIDHVLNAATVLYGDLFMDKPGVCEDFYQRRMFDCFNVVLCAVQNEDTAKKQIVASLTATFNVDFVVLNAIGIKSKVLSGSKTNGFPDTTWQRRHIGTFLLRVLVVYYYSWNRAQLTPILIQVNRSNVIAILFL